MQKGFLKLKLNEDQINWLLYLYENRIINNIGNIPVLHFSGVNVDLFERTVLDIQKKSKGKIFRKNGNILNTSISRQSIENMYRLIAFDLILAETAAEKAEITIFSQAEISKSLVLLRAIGTPIFAKDDIGGTAKKFSHDELKSIIEASEIGNKSGSLNDYDESLTKDSALLSKFKKKLHQQNKLFELKLELPTVEIIEITLDPMTNETIVTLKVNGEILKFKQKNIIKSSLL